MELTKELRAIILRKLQDAQEQIAHNAAILNRGNREIADLLMVENTLLREQIQTLEKWILENSADF